MKSMLFHTPPLPQDRSVLLRVLEGKPARVPVELTPVAVRDTVGQFIAAVGIQAEGKDRRTVFGGERFHDRVECERHAIRTAYGAVMAFGKCRDWDKYEFTVTTQGDENGTRRIRS